MKARFTNLVCALCFTFVLEFPAYSQSTVYLDDRYTFESSAFTLPGTFQRITDFPAVNGPELTMSYLTFGGRYLVSSPNGVLWNFDGSAPGISIHFAKGAVAFGADFSSALSSHGFSTFTATISLDNGESFQFTAPTDPNFRFFGFISPTPIMEVTFSDGGLLGLPAFSLHEEALRNITVVTVPEPCSLALLGCGGVLLAGSMLKRFRSRESRKESA